MAFRHKISKHPQKFIIAALIHADDLLHRYARKHALMELGERRMANVKAGEPEFIGEIPYKSPINPLRIPYETPYGRP